jgi:hypothetical protein
MVNSSRTSAALRDALSIGAVKVAISGLVLAQGFRALSDDDYARIVIAQRFVAAPALDPSGTSWLPFPFWINGAIMRVFGRDPNVARATAIALGVTGALLVWIAARWLGRGRRGALLGALLAAAFPYSAWLGAATVPEAFTAALVVFGSASASVAGAPRLLGAGALWAACLSRYEAWPVALVFAVLCARDALVRRERTAAFAALIALSAPAAWIAHGVLSHGDALFFLARVAAYRRALGAAPSSFFAGLLGYPLAVLRCEPELMTLTAFAIWGARRAAPSGTFARYRRLFWQLAALLAFLVIGDVLDGAPTHHGERAVLALWFAAAIVAGDSLVLAASALETKARSRLAVLATAGVLLGAFVLRPWFARRDAFIDRGAELSIGRQARETLAAGERLAIYTTDLGFFAAIAGFSAPERALVLDEHDPRHPADTLSARTLRERLNAERAAWLLTSRSEPAPALPQGRIHTERDGFVLIRIRGD